MKTYACVYFGAALVAMFAMPLVARLARAIGLMDRPGVRKVHDRPVPRIGGVAIFVGFFALTVPVLLLDNTIGEAFREVRLELLALTVGAVLAFLLGLIDDTRGLPARVKLIGLVTAAVLVCACGVRIDSDISLGFGSVKLGWLSWPLTILWITGITSAVNLVDGLDGLAGGIAAATCGVICIFAIYEGQPLMATGMLALLGSLTGFLFFNFNPAKVFMGDSGTLFVGFMISASSVLSATKSATLVGLAMPALALGLPIYDTLLSVIRRILERRSIFSPDGSHIHHHLLRVGLSHRAAVLTLYAATLLCAGAGVMLIVSRDASMAYAALGVLVLLLVLFRLAGAMRFRGMFRAAQRNLRLARDVRQQRRTFDDTELRLREAKDFRDWWEGICTMAARMGFQSVTIWRPDIGTGSGRLVWRAPKDENAPQDSVEVSLPILRARSIGVWKLKVAINIESSLEATGHRAALLARLIDEHPPLVAEGILLRAAVGAGRRPAPIRE